MLKTILPVLVTFTVATALPNEESKGYSWAQLLNAIRYVETGSQRNGGIGAVGDNGKALGPYQIWEIYWLDANIKNRRYKEVLHDKKLSERVIYNYMKRYQPEPHRRFQAGTASLSDVEIISRTHNGGPKGILKKSTKTYFRKVVTALRR